MTPTAQLEAWLTRNAARISAAGFRRLPDEIRSPLGESLAIDLEGRDRWCRITASDTPYLTVEVIDAQKMSTELFREEQRFDEAMLDEIMMYLENPSDADAGEGNGAQQNQ